ncbi:MAG: TIGR01777 family protein [SAR324 cluster bacterium]|nr:TIGR01777 family protein [SAR324 cluster bacterium]
MNILVTGSSGLVGSQLVTFLREQGHAVFCLVRTATHLRDHEIHWNPLEKKLDAAKLEKLDAVVHLAGESIASGRWTNEKKERIRSSRVQGTQFLCDTLSTLNDPPSVLISASAMGYYGNRGSEILTEESAAGSGFLPNVACEWENAADTASSNGIRVVKLRFGIILSPQGGAFAKMLVPFRMGIGGRIGNGQQYMSWIVLDDVIHIIKHALQNKQVEGAVNISTPTPVTNLEFTKTLGTVLKRPTIFPLPGTLALLAFGEMADDLLLASTRMEPASLLKTGYAFRHPMLKEAFEHLLNIE